MTTMVLQPIDLSLQQQQDYADVRQKASEVIDQPDFWLATAHPMLDAKSPAELVADGRKEVVLDLIGLIKQGAFS